VGAHHGDYARYIKAAHTRATVHCFELSAGNIKTFSDNAENARAGLELHEFGLGSNPGEFEIFESPTQSQVVSLHAVSGDARRSTGRIRRGDQFCAEAGINGIAFLKVDTEGNDLDVLRGFGEMLTPGKIECIQFEYNECSVGARVLLNDFFQLLEPAGYTLGKIYPRAVEFGPYSIHLEDHRANNYCAVGRGSALEQRLAGKKYWGRGLR
jgi:FkbM family methyltransferase